MIKLLDSDCSHYKGLVMILMRLFLAFIFIKAGMGKLPIVTGEGLTNALPLFLVYLVVLFEILGGLFMLCLLYTSPSPRDGLLSRMPSSA